MEQGEINDSIVVVKTTEIIHNTCRSFCMRNFPTGMFRDGPIWLTGRVCLRQVDAFGIGNLHFGCLGQFIPLIALGCVFLSLRLQNI